MKSKWIKGISVGLCVCLLASMTACGKNDSENLTQVSGRVSAVADGEITLSIFEKPENGKMPQDNGQRGPRPDGVSGDALEGRERPEIPDGTPPADMKDKLPQKGEKPENGKMPQDKKKIVIKDNTKVYMKQGEEKVEGSMSDVQLGSMVMVELNGDEAVSITIEK